MKLRKLPSKISQKIAKFRGNLNAQSICDDYHKWFYNNQVWTRTTYRGVGCLKSPSDMWNYQEIICGLKPSLIVEFGTFNGASALFFSDILKAENPESKVFSVDVVHDRIPESIKKNQHIEFMKSSSADPSVGKRIVELRKKYKGAVFAILDSRHTRDHVYAEMIMLREILKKGDYMIVEDSNINGHPVAPGYGPGPMEAILDYLKNFPEDYTPDVEREKKFGFTFAPKGFLKRN